MKIVAGIGSIDDYIPLVKAGADEVFCGFVPYEWNKKYGNLFPLNRREVLYYNAQINSYDEMKILKKMMDKYRVPVAITFNYLYYVKEQYDSISEIIKNLINIGFEHFIIADIALILHLKSKNIKCKIHLSGECAEINRLSLKFLKEFNISRIIFHRKNTMSDMKNCIKENKDLEFEAFMLNEKCHYTGAFCSSLHTDELIHLCKMPYLITKYSEDKMNFKNTDEKLSSYYESSDDNMKENGYVVGRSGCGLCSLEQLKNLGVTHLKVVGRGNFIDVMIKDVQNLKKALNLMGNVNNICSFEETLKSKLFNNKCSDNCYYL